MHSLSEIRNSAIARMSHAVNIDAEGLGIGGCILPYADDSLDAKPSSELSIKVRYCGELSCRKAAVREFRAGLVWMKWKDIPKQGWPVKADED